MISNLTSYATVLTSATSLTVSPGNAFPIGDMLEILFSYSVTSALLVMVFLEVVLSGSFIMTADSTSTGPRFSRIRLMITAWLTIFSRINIHSSINASLFWPLGIKRSRWSPRLPGSLGVGLRFMTAN